MRLWCPRAAPIALRRGPTRSEAGVGPDLHQRGTSTPLGAQFGPNLGASSVASRRRLGGDAHAIDAHVGAS